MLKTLNPAQREAVCHNEGPLLVVAGAGSGKTRVITHKIAYLIQELGIPERNILAVTFTNKAAAEMRHRAMKLLDRPDLGSVICTFHSLCLRILRQEAPQLGYGPDFSICDPSDAQTIIKDILKQMGRKQDKAYAPKKVQALLSRIKNRSMDTEEVGRMTDLESILDRYDRTLMEMNLMDFDDLLLNTVRLLDEFPATAAHYRERFPCILVDEFQDTNAVQYRLIRLLEEGGRHICAVGDEDQSIYGWRGADFENILKFPEDFPDTRLITLEQNYRSSQGILDIANSIISNNRMRNPKTLRSTISDTGDHVVYEAPHAAGEASFVTRQIRSLIQQEVSARDIVVLYRANYLSRSLEDALRRENLPYRIVGGYKFYERKEIKDILAYLKLMRNPSDNPSFQRIVNVPRRKVGPATLEKLAAVDPVFTTALERLPEGFPRYSELVELRRILTMFTERKDFGPGFIQDLIDKLAYIEMLKSEEEPLEAETRIENLFELTRVVEDYAESTDSPSLAGFLDEISLLSDADDITDEESVSLMTIHCAKGLEYHTVFVVGLEEGTFPNQRTMGSSRELEEERRLMYVAITRAKRNLYLSFARERGWGWESSRKRMSRFLREIPAEQITTRGTGLERMAGYLQASHSRHSQTETVPPAVSPDEIPGKGETVHHATYGTGTVLNVVNNERLVVKFKKAGIKVLRVGAVSRGSR